MLSFLILICCSKNLDNDVQNPIINSNQNNVSISDIHCYINAKYKITKSNYNIDVIINDSDSLLYIINYGDKWEIISGDKRCTPILAYGDGRFDTSDINPAKAVWLSSEAEIISQLKKGIETNDKTIENKIFWDALKRPALVTKDGEYEFKEEDEWELIEIKEANSILESSGHLIQTNWGQSYPWNQCVPYIQGTTTRCPAGCVAVAGAQMLYFLHNKYNNPSNFYTSGNCSGDNTSFSFTFNNSSTAAWSNMAKNASDFERSFYQTSILLGWIGQQVNTQYAENGSSGDVDLLGTLFRNFGYQTDYETFSHSAAFSRLKLNGAPSIVTAYSDRTDLFLGMAYQYENGHCWIIDGYAELTKTYEYIYKWTSRTENDQFEYGELYTRTIEETTEYVMMDWGWEETDNGYYASNSTWMYSSTSPNFKYNRALLTIE